VQRGNGDDAMRRYLIVSGTTLVVHSAIAFGSTTYLRFLEWVGGWFVYGHDISVIADRAIAGFFLVGCVLIAASIGVAYVTRGSQSVGGE
jgi:hypothetical protein